MYVCWWLNILYSKSLLFWLIHMAPVLSLYLLTFFIQNLSACMFFKHLGSSISSSTRSKASTSAVGRVDPSIFWDQHQFSSKISIVYSLSLSIQFWPGRASSVFNNTGNTCNRVLLPVWFLHLNLYTCSWKWRIYRLSLHIWVGCGWHKEEFASLYSRRLRGMGDKLDAYWYWHQHRYNIFNNIIARTSKIIIWKRSVHHIPTRSTIVDSRFAHI